MKDGRFMFSASILLLGKVVVLFGMVHDSASEKFKIMIGFRVEGNDGSELVHVIIAFAFQLHAVDYFPQPEHAIILELCFGRCHAVGQWLHQMSRH
jgi:hypothetical protein